MRRAAAAAAIALLGSVVACTEEGDATPADGDGGVIDLGEVTGDGGAPSRGEGGGPIRFVTEVVSFTPGSCAGFGSESMPDIVLGPPKGAGNDKGGLDVVSLGSGGVIVLSFEPYEIVDGPGADFVVFENAFFAGGDPTKPYLELGEVSVSEDGETWTTFPCTATEPPYGDCAGWRPVFPSDAADPEALDVTQVGGDPFDLAAIGVTRARFVKIEDKTSQRCTSQGPNNNGFDLDAIAVVHARAR